MFGYSNGINDGDIVEFRIKFETAFYKYSRDAVGITTNVDDCASEDRWVTWNNDKVSGARYVYWGGGKIYCIASDGIKRNIVQCGYHWTPTQILTVRVDLSGLNRQLRFFWIMYRYLTS